MKKKKYLVIAALPVLFPVAMGVLIAVDALLHDYDPWLGEQSLGTAGALFSSFVVGVIVAIVCALWLKLKK